MSSDTLLSVHRADCGAAPAPAASVVGGFSRGKPIEHKGVWYPSRAALARKLGLCSSSVRSAACSGKMDSLGIGLDQARMRGIKSMNAACRKPIEWNGIVYPSQAALAKALGVSQSQVSAAKRLGRLDTLGIGQGFDKADALERSRRAASCPVASCGWHWPSQTAAERALGVNRGYVARWLNRGTLDKNVMARLGVKPPCATDQDV